MNVRDESGQVGLPIFLFMVLVGLIAGGLYMLDRLGLMNAREQVTKRLAQVPVVGEYVSPSSVSKQAKTIDQLQKMKRSLEEREKKLEQQEKKLDQQTDKLKKRRAELNQRQQDLRRREKALESQRSEFENEEERMDYLAALYSNMRPAEAASRLSTIQSDRVVIQILRRMQNRSTSIVLSAMDNQRAAALTRKMANFPSDQLN